MLRARLFRPAFSALFDFLSDFLRNRERLRLVAGHMLAAIIEIEIEIEIEIVVTFDCGDGDVVVQPAVGPAGLVRDELPEKMFLPHVLPVGFSVFRLEFRRHVRNFPLRQFGGVHFCFAHCPEKLVNLALGENLVIKGLFRFVVPVRFENRDEMFDVAGGKGFGRF